MQLRPHGSPPVLSSHLICALTLALFSGAGVPPLQADMQVLIAGGSRTIIATSGDSLTGGGFLRTRIDKVFWSPEASPDSGYLFVNHELSTPNGGLSRLRYESGAITEALNWVVGTHRNCAGRISSWGTILSCEEFPPSGQLGIGYVVEVDPLQPDTWTRQQALGRFSHESIVEDPVTGDLYLTDDDGQGVFFKFVPDTYGDLSSGSLYALREPTADWVLVTDPAHARVEAIALGATTYPRLEDIVYSPVDDAIYIMATGDLNVPSTRLGFILRFDPRTNLMDRWLDGDGPVMANPDNVEVDSYGNLLVHEDQYSSHISAYGPNELLLVRPDRTIEPILRGLDTSGEVTGLEFGGSDDRFWVCWQHGLNGSELLEVVLPAGWNAPTGGARTPAAAPAPTLMLRASPNPFRRTSTLRAAVGAGGRVRLDLFDARGVHLRTLLDGPVAPGELEAVWDGRDARHRRVAQGSYLVRLEVGGRVATSKLLVLR